jgi:hypothetical protein
LNVEEESEILSEFSEEENNPFKKRKKKVNEEKDFIEEEPVRSRL